MIVIIIAGFLGKTLLTLVRNKGPVSTAAASDGKQGGSKGGPSNPLPAHKFSPHDVVAVRPNATLKGGSGGASEGGEGDLAQGVVYRVYEDKIVVAVEDLADSATLDVPLRLDKLANKVRCCSRRELFCSTDRSTCSFAIKI